MSTLWTVLALIGLALGVVVLAVVQMLLQRLVRPLRECKRYADDILDAGVGITRHLDGAEELPRTVELAGAVPALASSFLAKGRP